MSETWNDIKQSMPIWAAQGRRFERQKMLWQRAQADSELQTSRDLAGKFLEDEAQILESRNRPGYVRPPSIADVPCDSRSMKRIAARCREFGSADAQTAGVEEQQERELAPKMERERQVKRLERLEPARRRINPAIKSFVQTGRVPGSDAGFLHAFETLRNTSASKHFDVARFPYGLRVTADFACTLQRAPRHPIPRSLRIELNLFAGQLYLASFGKYTDVCDYLCLSWGDTADVVAVDSFIEPRRRTRAHRGMANFAESPVQFLRTHLEKTRRDGSAIDKTHVGRMLAGLLLTDDDFARPKRKADELEGSSSPRPKRRADEPDHGTVFVDE